MDCPLKKYKDVCFTNSLSPRSMCILWNKPIPPSGFPRSLMTYVQQANVLGNPLGGVGLFHMIHIGHAQAFFLGFSMQTTVKHQICALSAIDRGTFNTFCITTRYAVSSLLYVSSPFLSFVAFIIHQGRLSNCKQDARKNRKQTKTVKILRKKLHFKIFVNIKFTGQESEPLGPV